MDYGVLCNFLATASDLETSASGFQYRATKSAKQLVSYHSVPLPFSFPVICSNGVAGFAMDAQCMTRLERFRMCTLHAFSPEMMKIWKNQIPHLAFRVFTHCYLLCQLMVIADWAESVLDAYHARSGCGTRALPRYDHEQSPDDNGGTSFFSMRYALQSKAFTTYPLFRSRPPLGYGGVVGYHDYCFL